MIADVFKLKKDSWHMKLMNWIWGYDHYDFPNMCPYFWLSLLNLFIAPFKAFFLLIKNVIVFVVTKITDALDKYEDYCFAQEEKWREQIKLKFVMNDPISVEQEYAALAEYYRKYTYDSNSSVPKRYRKLFDRDWSLREKLQPLAEQKQEVIWAEENKKAEAKVKIKTTRMNIAAHVVKIKIVAKILGVGIVLVGGFYLLKLIYWLLSMPDWWQVLKVFGEVLLYLFVIGIIIGIAYVISRLVKWFACRYLTFCIPCEARRDAILRFFGVIGSGILTVFLWMWLGIKQVWEILKALKQNNCPAIDWE